MKKAKTKSECPKPGADHTAVLPIPGQAPSGPRTAPDCCSSGSLIGGDT